MACTSGRSDRRGDDRQGRKRGSAFDDAMRWAARLVLLSANAIAQPADFLWPGVARLPDGVRSQGMAGAHVGLADDVATTTSNPAGLALVGKSVHAEFSTRGAALAVRPSARVTAGLFGTYRPRGQAILEAQVPSRELRPSASLSLGYRPLSRLGLGLSIETPRIDRSKAASEASPTVTLGVLAELGSTSRFGGRPSTRVRLGASVRLARGRGSPDPVDTFSFGGSWRRQIVAGVHVAASGQLDYLGQLATSRLEPRVALEASFFRPSPGSTGLVQLRAGVWRRLERVTSAREATHVVNWSAGMSFSPPRESSGLGGRLRIDFAVVRANRGTTLDMAIALRFPRSFRTALLH